MTIMASRAAAVIGGIDTHQDTHTAAAVDEAGRGLGSRSFPTTRAGYRALLAWLRTFGTVVRVGVESTGCYGAGIARHLAAEGIEVLEVTGPDLAKRRSQGKDDRLDAEAAAEAARLGVRSQVAKLRHGAVEGLQMLRNTRASAVKVRRAALQSLHNAIVAAPDPIRERLRDLSRTQQVRVCAGFRCHASRPLTSAAKSSLRSLARRIVHLDEEIAELDRLIEPMLADIAPQLLEVSGVGPACAAALLVTAGENPERLRSEGSFAMLCGASPIPASSGKTSRYRLNRGGDRQANAALHMVVVTRMRHDPRTKAYIARRLEEGKSKREIMRCLKRYVARELYRVLLSTPY